jgi:hypothetical protein
VLSERARLVLVIIVLLALGAALSRILPRAEQSDATILSHGMWLVRRTDLLLQAVLGFVGGLGIRALLPLDEE